MSEENKNLVTKTEENKGESDSLISLIDELEKESSYSDILDLVEEYYPQSSDSIKPDLLTRKAKAYLKLEQYNDVIVTLDEVEKFKDRTNVDKANTLFYKSIAYEALDEYNLAIKTLESIIDNISKYTLINKYLKLSMLYLKVNEKNKAKEAYDYASMLDRTHSNDIFLLVESDLYYNSEKYLEALESFQSFFLKSRNKYKYLDRYILINVKLKRYEDAYNFYKKYIEMPSIKLSSQNRFHFLKAVEVLLKDMKKDKDLSIIHSAMESIKPVYFKKEENEKIKIIESIIENMSFPLTIYDKYKNIANRFFKLLNCIDKEVLVFVEVVTGGYLYSIFNNTQLKEKEIVAETILNEEEKIFFEELENKTFDYYFDHNHNKFDKTVKKYVIGNKYKTYGYFFVDYLEENDDIYNILSKTLLEVYSRLDSMTKESGENTAFFKLLERENKGLIRIKNDTVEYLDPYSKKLFMSKTNVVKYHDFSKFFMNEFYPDELMGKSEVIRELLIGENAITLSMKPYVDGDSIYVEIKNVKDEIETRNVQTDFLKKSGLKFRNENSLKEKITQIETSYALIGFTIPLITSLDTFSKREEKLNALYNLMYDETGIEEIYYLGENHYLIFDDRIDKRVLEGIYKRIEEKLKTLYKYSYDLRAENESGFISKSLKGKTYTEVKELLEYGFFYSSLKNDFIVLDNEEKRDYALYRTHEAEIIRRLKKKSFDIDYYPIIDESNNTIHYFLPRFSLPYGITESLYNRILDNNNLRSKADSVLFELLLNDAKDFVKDIRFIVPLSKESVTNQNFIKTFRENYKESILKGRVIFLVDSVPYKDFKKGIESLRNMGIHLAVNYDSTNLSNDEYKDYSMIMVRLKEETDFNKLLVYGFESVLKKRVVVVDGVNINGTLSIRSTYNAYNKEKIKSFSNIPK